MLRSSAFTDYYLRLEPPPGLGKGIEVLYPQSQPEVQQITRAFFRKFYHDKKPRKLILGINPGRHGAGLTGINFTAPRQLGQDCALPHSLGDSSELSAEFIYDVIRRYGGPASFYAEWYIGAVCPLGFVQRGKNLNYYDDALLLKKLTSFIVQQISLQVQLTGGADQCLCLGEGKNFNYLCRLNEKYHWFREILPLAHPRFIMQYKRREKEWYIKQYLEVLQR